MTDSKRAGSVKPEDVEALVEIFQSSDWEEMHLEIEGFEIYLSKDPKARLAPVTVHPVAHAPAPEQPAAQPRAMGHAAPPPEPHVPQSDVPANWISVTAPNLGTFYRAPKPGAAPYVEVGQQVSADTELCLIEVMKLFTAVRAGTGGVVRRICVQDAQMVEYGETLFYIEPGP
ncbi:MAG: acetyl-CoA carboxylase biotin carboxyl carrier protein [Nitratireductor sp.]|jgi:acetyl-CoA carboxylase biotin carboxyl carrier protein|nr:acetyl-CoA carboxylase biotin carboxyl carrier protein [Nitratireductor sp.]